MIVVPLAALKPARLSTRYRGLTSRGSLETAHKDAGAGVGLEGWRVLSISGSEEEGLSLSRSQTGKVEKVPMENQEPEGTGTFL